MQVCSVCREQTPKYRCPVCKIRYCSLICYKKHKDNCLCVEQPPPPAKPDVNRIQSSGDQIVEEPLGEEDESDRVPYHKLQQLGGSQDLRALLRNPHLRQLLLTVDKAENKAEIMKVMMQEPLFVEVADQCLKLVEPVEEEDIGTMD